MADEKISQLSDAGAPQNTDQLVIARSGSSLSLLFSALKAAIPGGVTSVFTRTGAVTAQTGDYTAAQVGALPSTETLDQIATSNATAASVAMNSHKLTGLAAGSGNGDSLRYEQLIGLYLLLTGGTMSGAIAMGSNKITGLTNGSAAGDAAAFGQIPTALPPNGTAGGDLSGTYPNPAVAKITETSGPTDLTIGTLTDGQFLKRSGSTIVSAAAGATPGGSSLVYRYTVTGSDKASIDTGVDTPNAGSNDWTNCDLLEIMIYARTDESTQASQLNFTFNNDTGSVYDVMWNRSVGTTVAGVSSPARANIGVQVAGSTATSGQFGVIEMKIPNPTGTVANKTVSGTSAVPDSGDSTNQVVSVFGGDYHPASPAALTRLAVVTNAGGQKLKVGSQLLIYKRLAS